MGIGRIAALLGSLAPSAPTEQVPTEAVASEPAVTASEQSHSFDRAAQDNGGSDAAAQIQAVVNAIRQLNDNAGQDGAGMAFSQSGATLRDSVAALSHLLKNAQDSRTVLPQPLLAEAGAVVGAVEARMETVRRAVDERLERMAAADQQRVRQTTGAFLTEMHSLLYATRGVLGS